MIMLTKVVSNESTGLIVPDDAGSRTISGLPDVLAEISSCFAAKIRQVNPALGRGIIAFGESHKTVKKD
jgi:hypothetical protein